MLVDESAVPSARVVGLTQLIWTEPVAAAAVMLNEAVLDVADDPGFFIMQ